MLDPEVEFSIIDVSVGEGHWSDRDGGFISA